MIEQSRLVGAHYWIQPLSLRAWAAVALQFFNTPLNSLPELPVYQALPLAAVTAAVLWPWRGRPAERQLVCLVLMHVAVIIGVGLVLERPVVVPRYLVYLFPLCTVPVAYWLHRIPDTLVRRLALVWVLVVACVSLFNGSLEWGPFSHHQCAHAQIAEVLSREAAPDEPVLVFDVGAYLSMRYYLQHLHLPNPCWVDDPALDDVREHHVVFSGAIYPQDRRTVAQLSRSGTARCWVVGSADVSAYHWVLLSEETYSEENPVSHNLIALKLYAIPY